MAQLDKFIKGTSDGMIAYGKTALGKSVGKPEPIQVWKTGFDPLDLVMGGGVYQGLLIVMAPPGSGKTSTMLSIAAGIKQAHPEWRAWFFEEEIPEGLMLSRMRPLMKHFSDDDQLVSGGLSIHEIAEELQNDRDRDKVVFVDSPDSMPGLSADNRRFELGYIYRELVRIKERSQLVVVASQPRRSAKGQLTLKDVAESWEKAWFADMMVGVWGVGQNQMHMRCLKNRFGPFGKEVTYEYDLATLEWGNPILEDEDW